MDDLVYLFIFVVLRTVVLIGDSVSALNETLSSCLHLLSSMSHLNNAERRELTSAWHNLFSSSWWWTRWRHIWKILLFHNFYHLTYHYFPHYSIGFWALSFHRKKQPFYFFDYDEYSTLYIILTAPHACDVIRITFPLRHTVQKGKVGQRCC